MAEVDARDKADDQKVDAERLAPQRDRAQVVGLEYNVQHMWRLPSSTEHKCRRRESRYPYSGRFAKLLCNRDKARSLGIKIRKGKHAREYDATHMPVPNAPHYRSL